MDDIITAAKAASDRRDPREKRPAYWLSNIASDPDAQLPRPGPYWCREQLYAEPEVERFVRFSGPHLSWNLGEPAERTELIRAGFAQETQPHVKAGLFRSIKEARDRQRWIKYLTYTTSEVIGTSPLQWFGPHGLKTEEAHDDCGWPQAEVLGVVHRMITAVNTGNADPQLSEQELLAMDCLRWAAGTAKTTMQHVWPGGGGSVEDVARILAAWRSAADSLSDAEHSLRARQGGVRD